MILNKSTPCFWTRNRSLHYLFLVMHLMETCSCCLQAWQGLSAELSKDMSRLWRRNLGRDDRIIADTGREARHPFLDEQFIETLLGLPLPLVADLRLPPGTGDKQLLRMALLRYSIPTDHPRYCITRCMPLALMPMKGAEFAHRLA